MATLYVENIPDDVYSALRERARLNRNSIATEVLSLLQENVVTPSEMKARAKFVKQLELLRRSRKRTSRSFPSTEDMQHEDRLR